MKYKVARKIAMHTKYEAKYLHIVWKKGM